MMSYWRIGLTADVIRLVLFRVHANILLLWLTFSETVTLTQPFLCHNTLDAGLAFFFVSFIIYSNLRGKIFDLMQMTKLYKDIKLFNASLRSKLAIYLQLD